ncbi:zinc-dependent metalloprotease [Maribacter litoralis]|uniref:zinc-dependent metalloprotease n=1 Tax=Maribacter litoralis TaxID=2059726 RepID=UPI003F5CE8E9
MKKVKLISWLWLGLIALPIWACPDQSDRDSATIEDATKPLKADSFLTTFIRDGKLYLDLPQQLLDTPMLFVRYDLSYERQYLQVVWSLEGGKILLKTPRIHSSAGVILPLEQKRSLKENILGIFPLESHTETSGRLRIDITDLIMNEVVEWSPGFTENLVPQISLLEEAKNLYDEIIIKTRRGLRSNGSKISIPVYYGLSALPDLMEGRSYDYRMGFYNEDMGGIDYDHAKNSVANIARWRLEKSHSDQGTSVPVRPITFVLSPDIPKKWRTYVREGILDWSAAFTAAGFKDALIVKETDSLSEWQVHSIHTSVIHWGDAKYLRGFDESGGTVSRIMDYRTGEILKCDIHLGASLQNLSDQYFVRCAPLDERAQRFPFPEDLAGSLFRALTAHEAGHAFGLMDSNYGEYAYPYEKMNDCQWLKTMGHTPSIMNYARENNIAQPEDSVPPELLVPKVGPMDRYQIRWAYSEFPEKVSKEQEQAALEGIIRVQDSIPWFRYNNSRFEVIGPAASDEVVETDHPVQSTKLALKNLERVIGMLPWAVKDQSDNARLEHLYLKALELWYDHMRYVLSLVGGYDIHYKSIHQPGKMYTPIAWNQQEEALEFLLDHAFDPPKWLVRPNFLLRLSYSTYPDKVVDYQKRLVWELMRTQRLKRFEYMETLEGYQGCHQRFLSNLRDGLFRELHNGSDQVERKRQELQSFYIDKLLSALAQKEKNITADKKAFDFTEYSKGLLMEQWETLKKDIKRKIQRIKTGAGKGHWIRCLAKLDSLDTVN